jgi:hypothetical protein
VFVTDCIRLDATILLAKSRGARFTPAEASRGDLTYHATLQRTEDGRPEQWTVDLPLISTKQHLGGRRLWWRCPVCGSRRRVLLAINFQGPIACRACYGAQHLSDYPAHARRRRLVDLFNSSEHGSLDHDAEQELAWLQAPRRRGVRRGRRLEQRIRRACERLEASYQGASDLARSKGF